MQQGTMRRYAALALAVLGTMSCGRLTDAEIDAGGSDWPPLDEATFERLPVWNGVLELHVTFGISENRTEFGAGVMGRNTGTTRFDGEASPSHWVFRAYASPVRTGEPVWSGWTLKRRGFALVFRAAPGDSAFLSGGRLDFPVASLAEGSYYFTASLGFRPIGSPSTRPEIRTPFFDAGEFEIVR